MAIPAPRLPLPRAGGTTKKIFPTEDFDGFGYKVEEPTELELIEQKMKDEIGLSTPIIYSGSKSFEEERFNTQTRMGGARAKALPTLDWNDGSIISKSSSYPTIDDLPEPPEEKIHESWEYNESTGRYQQKKLSKFARFKAWLAKKS